MLQDDGVAAHKPQDAGQVQLGLFLRREGAHGCNRGRCGDPVEVQVEAET
jgi:hypothetical protein